MARREGKVIPYFMEQVAKKLPVYKIDLKRRFKGNTDSIDYYLNKPHPVKLFDYEQRHL